MPRPQGSHQIHSHHDAQHIAHLVGQILQQLFCVGNAHPLVVPANYQHAAIGIREATDSAQVFIPPGLLPFGVLVFVHG